MLTVTKIRHKIATFRCIGIKTASITWGVKILCKVFRSTTIPKITLLRLNGNALIFYIAEIRRLMLQMEHIVEFNGKNI